MNDEIPSRYSDNTRQNIRSSLKLIILVMSFIVLTLGIYIEPKIAVSYHSVPLIASEHHIVNGNSLIGSKGILPDVYVYGTLINKIVQCESGWRQNDENGNILVGDIHLEEQAYGIAQFQMGTWKHFNELRGTNLDIYNEQHQLEMLAWALNNNLGYHWTCYNNL